MERKAYPSDISDEEWGFVAPYLTLMTEEAPQREYSLHEVFNGTQGIPGWLVRAGASWRMICHRGGWFTSKPSVGSKQGCLKPWFMTYAPSYAWRRDAKHNPRRSFWTVALCSR